MNKIALSEHSKDVEEKQWFAKVRLHHAEKMGQFNLHCSALKNPSTNHILRQRVQGFQPQCSKLPFSPQNFELTHH